MSDEMREAFEAKIKATPFTGEIAFVGGKYTNAWVQKQWEAHTGENKDYLDGYQAATAAADAKYLPVIEKLVWFVKKLVWFVKELSENESSPSETIADNGMTVWDGYQECAKGLLHIAATVMKGGK